MPLYEKELLFIDLETTGLDPNKHEIIEIALLGETYAFCSKVKPRNIENASPIALEVNGYNEEEWADAPYLEEIIPQILKRLDNTQICGHNPTFDISFLKAHIPEFTCRVRPVDTATLAIEHLGPCGLEKASLDSVCEFLGISNRNNHRAEVDARRCMEAYHILCRATILHRLYWALKHRYFPLFMEWGKKGWELILKLKQKVFDKKKS